jgi:hypothetical protein
MAFIGRGVGGLVVAAVLGVAACGIPAIHFEHFDIAYSPGETAWGAGDALFVEVIGRPKSDPRLDDRAWQALVAGAIQDKGPQWFRTTYTTDASKAHDRRYRLRVLFGIPVNFNIDTACEDRWRHDHAKWRQASDLMAITFCRGQRELSAARGSVGKLGEFRPREEAFRDFIGIAARIVLPIRNPEFDTDCFDSIDCI